MLKNLSLSKKLTVSFSTILLLLLVAIMSAIFGIRSVSTSMDNFYNQPYQIMQASKDVQANLQSAAKNMMTACALSDPTTAEARLQELDQNVAAFQANLDKLRTSYSGDLTLLDQVQATMDEAGQYRQQIAQLINEGQSQEALSLYISGYGPKLDSITAQLGTIEDTVNQQAVSYKEQSDRITRNTTIFFIAVGIFSIVIALIQSFRLGRSLRLPINELRSAASELSQGKLRGVKITYESRDELGQLADDMRSTIHTLDAYVTDISAAMKLLAGGDLNINPKVEFTGDFIELRDSILNTVLTFDEAVSQISVSAEQVSAGSLQVSEGAQELSQGSTEQSSSLQDLTNSVGEISTQVKSNAANALDGKKKVETLSSEIVSSNTHMQDMITAMDEISSTSGQIGRIIKTIEDIAFQTNILALNAAVEAARAGAAGKGFAVVADEVRNLATKSQEAAKNTTALIESSIRAVENGTRIADQTAKSLQMVVEGAQEVSETIDRITASSSEQATSIESVTMGIEQISAVVQTNSATAEESAAASEELSSQSMLLKELVSHFSLRPKATSSSR